MNPCHEQLGVSQIYPNAKYKMCEAKAVILDIEGTVISISFVKDVLFPYARRHLRTFLKAHWEDPELAPIVADLQEQAAKDGQEMLWEDEEEQRLSVESYVLWQMDRDIKAAPLKALQGLIWLDGYKDGHLVAPLYEDVVPALQQWKQEGKKLYIYSSGSVQAQKLLFAHTAVGNICDLLDGHFDITSAGSKVKPESYTNIGHVLGLPTKDCLFLTDIAAEAIAAASAGMKVRLVERPGNAPLSEEDRATFSPISSLDHL